MPDREREDDVEKEFLRTCASVRDLERRVLTVETNMKVNSDEISSLRSSRHEYGNWLNRHNLEINDLQTRAALTLDGQSSLVSKVNLLQTQVTQLELSISTRIATMAGEIKHTMWIISGIVGLIVLVVRSLMQRYGL